MYQKDDKVVAPFYGTNFCLHLKDIYLRLKVFLKNE